jgi:ribonuclease P protein component
MSGAPSGSSRKLTVTPARPIISPVTALLGAFRIAKTHVSTQACSAQARARISQTHELAGRQSGAAASPASGAQAADRRLDSQPRPLRWPKSAHLRKSAEIERVRTSGRSWAHPLVVLIAGPNDLHSVRLGLAVSKRVGSAVARNRVRRRIREIIRLRQHDLKPGFDLLFIARPPSASASWNELCGAVDGLLRRAHLSARLDRA